ncbi:hypothetical protein [Pseudomonas aeruginosa]
MSQAFVEKLNLFGARIATRPRAGGFLMILRLLYDDSAARSCTNSAPPSTNPCATWPSHFSSRNWTRMRG